MWWFFSDFGGRIEIFIGFFNAVGDGDGGIRRAGEEFSLIFMMNLILFSVLPTGMYNQVSQSVSISRVLMFTKHIIFGTQCIEMGKQGYRSPGERWL